MKECHLFDDPKSPAGMKVYQMTEDPERAGLIYPDQPSFLADGRRFVVNTSSGSQVCDPEDGSLRPVFKNGERFPVSLTFDGRYGYFNRSGGKKRKADAGEGEERKNEVTLARVDLDTGEVEDLFHAEGKLPGTDIDAKDFGIATVSVDNQRIATTVSLYDGKTPDAPYAIIALDLERGEARHVMAHRDFGNTHLQYCRNTEEPDAAHDLLVQMNHGSRRDAEGKSLRGQGPPSEKGVDIHVVRDDGTNWRDMPFGRDGKESCIGHQVWRGRGRSAATVVLENLDTSYGWAEGSRQGVVAGWPGPADIDGPHLGALNPETERVVLSEGFKDPRFCHLACDATGLKFTLDTFPVFDGERAGMQVYVGSAPDERSPLNFRYILNTGINFVGNNTGYHAHPILSPDGEILLFNSKITGTPQAYMVTGMWD